MDDAFARIRLRHLAPARYADLVDGDNNFPDGAILHIEADDPEHHGVPPKDKWLTEMSTFLSIGLPPPRMRTDEKKRLVV